MWRNIFPYYRPRASAVRVADVSAFRSSSCASSQLVDWLKLIHRVLVVNFGWWAGGSSWWRVTPVRDLPEGTWNQAIIAKRAAVRLVVASRSSPVTSRPIYAGSSCCSQKRSHRFYARNAVLSKSTHVAEILSSTHPLNLNRGQQNAEEEAHECARNGSCLYIRAYIVGNIIVSWGLHFTWTVSRVEKVVQLIDAQQSIEFKSTAQSSMR